MGKRLKDETWFLPDSTTSQPKYNRKVDYHEECVKYTKLKAQLENSLKNLLMVNSLVNDEGIKHDKRLRAAIEVQKLVQVDKEDEIAKKKRKRMYIKEFKCTYGKCSKDYTSIDALALHIKRKHPEQFHNFSLNRRRIKRDVLDKKESQQMYAGLSSTKDEKSVCE